MTTHGDVEKRIRREPAAAQESAWPSRLQILGLLILAPVCAEYLAAYDDSTGSPLRLIGSLVIFTPLYGVPALLIREVCRRAGLGWIGMIALAAAFGLIEAGIVDQSLFSLDYRHIESWDATLRGTFIGPLGLSAYNLLNFVGGHVVYSICAPIALIEALRPATRTAPWLNRWTIALTALLYVGASALVLVDSLINESSHASPAQVLVSAAVVLLLVVAAVGLGRRRTARAVRPAPRARSVFLIALLIALIYNAVPPTWLGVSVEVVTLAAGLGLLVRAARSRQWGIQHVAAIAAAAVLTRAALAFTYFPLLGDVSGIRKYGHNVTLLVGMAVLSMLAMRITRDKVQPVVTSPRHEQRPR